MTDAPSRQPRRNWTQLALIVSLAINLAVAGLIAGLFSKGPPPDVRAGAGLGRYGATLPDPYRRDLGRAMRESRPDWAGRRGDLRDQRAAFAAALTADPFDPGAIAAALAAERELLGALADRGAALLLAQIERMTPEERRDYAEALLRDRRGPPGRRD